MNIRVENLVIHTNREPPLPHAQDHYSILREAKEENGSQEKHKAFSTLVPFPKKKQIYDQDVRRFPKRLVSFPRKSELMIRIFDISSFAPGTDQFRLRHDGAQTATVLYTTTNTAAEI